MEIVQPPVKGQAGPQPLTELETTLHDSLTAAGLAPGAPAIHIKHASLSEAAGERAAIKSAARKLAHRVRVTVIDDYTTRVRILAPQEPGQVPKQKSTGK